MAFDRVRGSAIWVVEGQNFVPLARHFLCSAVRAHSFIARAGDKRILIRHRHIRYTQHNDSILDGGFTPSQIHMNGIVHQQIEVRAL